MSSEKRSSGEISLWFGRFATKSAQFVGSPGAFIGSVVSVVIWAAIGDSWQLMINTATTVITFWIVFLIQNTQNRDARAIHLKLDEVIRSIRAAHNEMIDIEKLSDKQLEEIASYYEKLKAAGPIDSAETVES